MDDKIVELHKTVFMNQMYKLNQFNWNIGAKFKNIHDVFSEIAAQQFKSIKKTIYPYAFHSK